MKEEVFKLAIEDLKNNAVDYPYHSFGNFNLEKQILINHSIRSQLNEDELEKYNSLTNNLPLNFDVDINRLKKYYPTLEKKKILRIY